LKHIDNETIHKKNAIHFIAFYYSWAFESFAFGASFTKRAQNQSPFSKGIPRHRGEGFKITHQIKIIYEPSYHENIRDREYFLSP
jgi:hypothetical protein